MRHLPRRARALSLFLAAATPAVALAAPPTPAPLPGLPGLPGAADGGFRMEPRAAIDDVFGDSADYRKTIDRFLALSDTMQRTRDQFARSVQAALAQVMPRQGDKSSRVKKCPEAEVAKSYARALDLGQGYLRTGRELTRRYEQVREFDRLGETIGLTPDYRIKVKKVFAQYASLLVDYREMKVAFHDQLSDELKFAGCDLDHLVARANAAGAERAEKDEWPEAPGSEQPALATVAENDNPDATDPNAAITSDPAALPTRNVPPAGGTQPKTVPATATMNGATAALQDRSGILFYVDNTRCPTGTRVALDGRPVGDVPAATRAAFQTTPGPHDLCLLPSDAPSGGGARHCGEAGTVRRSYLHEGWTISLRCE